MKRAVAGLLVLGGCGGGLHGTGLPLGFEGRFWCDARDATGAVELDEQGRVRAGRPGHGEVVCADGDRQPVDVRPAARVEISILGQPVADEAWYAYTRVYDADGRLLFSVSDQFEWSAQNADIQPGTCGVSESADCIRDSSAATFRARAPSATIEVRYLGASASREIPVQLPR